MNEQNQQEPGTLAPERPTQKMPAIVAGHRPTAIVPTDMDGCYRFAKAIMIAGMNPKGMDNAEACMLAIMHGLEIGLTPLSAIQRIAIINGRPTIWGDAAIGLVRASGQCEWIREWTEGEGDDMAAHCWSKRRGDPEISKASFSVAEAKKAGLWETEARVTKPARGGGTYTKDNDSPWYRFPKRMLQMRARAFCLRDLYADILGGLYLREEIEDEDRFKNARDMTPESEEKPAPARRARRAAPPPPAAIEHGADPVMETAAPNPTPAAVLAAEQTTAAQTMTSESASAGESSDTGVQTARKAPPPPGMVERAEAAFSAEKAHVVDLLPPIEDKPKDIRLPVDPEALREVFFAALMEARDEGGADEAYDDLIAPEADDLFPPDLQMFRDMLEHRKAALRRGF